MDIRIPLIVGLLFVIVLVFSYLGVGFGFDASTTKDYIAIIPSFLFILAGLYIVVKISGMYSFPAMTMIGFGFAILLQTMYSNGYITPAMTSGLTISQISFWVIVISGLSGGIIASVTAKR